MGSLGNPGGSPNPYHVNVIAQLNQAPFNFDEKSFRFNSLCFGGDRYICVKEEVDGANTVNIVDLMDDNTVEKRTTKKADGAIKYPSENVLVLKGVSETHEGHFVQVFNLDSKVRLGEHEFEGESVVFWKWMGNKTLAIVTTNSVYHWALRNSGDEAETRPQLIFARAGKLEDAQIINYCCDNESNPADAKWCLLSGIWLSPTDKKAILGSLQLYSIEKQQQQFLEGHAGCFGTLSVTDPITDDIRVFSFVERKGNVSKIYVMDIYNRAEDSTPPFKCSVEFSYPGDSQNDFPINLHISAKYGVVMAVTKGGYLMMWEAKTGQRILHQKFSQDTIFLCTAAPKTGGIMAVNRTGSVFSIVPNESTLIAYIQAHCPNGTEIAANLAKRYGYQQADEYLTQLFRQAFQAQQYKTAAKILSIMKSEALRTPSQLNAFKQAKGEPTPMLQFFSVLLDSGCRLTQAESIELVRPVVAQGRREFAAKWVEEGKLNYSEQLGDILKPLDEDLAMKVYQRSNCHQKVIQHYVSKSMFTEILAYIKRKKYAADFSFLLRSMINVNPEAAVEFTKQLLDNNPPLMNVDVAADVFLQQGKVQEITGILLDVLKANKPDQGALQTRLLEINLAQSPQAAEAIFQTEQFTYYDREKIGKLCEKAGLFTRALEHYTNLPDIKRVLIRCGGQLNVQWLTNFFDKLSPESGREVLAEMLRSNRGNMQAVVQVCIKYHEKLGADKLIKMFETLNSSEGLFYFLGSVIAFSNDPEVHFKYIEAAAKLNHIQEVERVCKESKFYDPIRVKEFLKSANLTDPRPLIYVCDIHNYIEELTEYLYHNNLTKYIDVYVTKVNPQAAPSVVVSLVDLGCPQDFILDLLSAVRGACPLEPMIVEMEKRGRLNMIQAWLEARVTEGNTEAVLHNALAKIYIDTNQDPANFLNTNFYYEHRAIGRYCEERDPHLAVAAYMKGECDQELVRVTNQNGLFRIQAKYLVQRKSAEAWAFVLTEHENQPYRKNVIDQVVACGLPEATSSEEISFTVKAFVSANLPNELLEILERIVLHKTAGRVNDLSNEGALQNLLLLTAFKADPSRLTDYINRLDGYDAVAIAKVALSDEHKLYEEALHIYKKAGMHSEAMDVVINYLKKYDEASKYAAQASDPAVWAQLGKCELQRAETALESGDRESANKHVCQSIEAYMKAEDTSQYRSLINVGQQSGSFTPLIAFLRMARTQRSAATGDYVIDSELIYCLAKSFQLDAIETFLSGNHTANVQLIGDRLFQEGCDEESAASECKEEAASSEHVSAAKLYFRSAKTLFSKLNNHGRLTMCYLKLEDYGTAIESAKKAASPKLWRDVNLACVQAKQFKHAHTAGTHVVTQPDHLEDLIQVYLNGGHVQELLSLLESGVATGKAHVGLYTELAVVYAEYRPQKLEDFIKSCQTIAGRLNVVKLIRACSANCLWKEATLLYLSYNEYDQALNLMMQHPSQAWTHERFVEVLRKVTNSELFYKAVSFYLEYAPLELCSMLSSVAMKVDHARIIQYIKRSKLQLESSNISESPLKLIQSYLEDEQPKCNSTTNAVNEVLHDLYLFEEDISSLKKSVTHFDNFDQVNLATQLEKHARAEMRELAVYLFQKNKKYSHAIELAKKLDSLNEAIKIARDSKDSELASCLLKHFVELQRRDLFAECLSECSELIQPSAALELTKLSGFKDEIIPFMIQTIGSMASRIESLEKRVDEFKSAEKRDKKSVPDFVPGLSGFGGLALLPVPSAGSPYGSQSGLGTMTL